MENVRYHEDGKQIKHVGILYPNKDQLIDSILAKRKALGQNKTKKFLEVRLDCGCEKKYNKRDIPGKEDSCGHGNSYISYSEE